MNPEYMMIALKKMVDQGVYSNIEEALNSVFEDRRIVDETHRPGREKLTEDRSTRRTYGRVQGGDQIANRWCKWDNPKKDIKVRTESETDKLAVLYKSILEDNNDVSTS